MKFSIIAIILIVIIVVVYIFATILINVMFVRESTEVKIKLSKEYEVLFDGVLIKEVTKGQVFFSDATSLKGTLPSSEEKVLLDDGSISSKARFYDDDPGETVSIVPAVGEVPSLLFHRNDVFEVRKNKNHGKVGEFKNPGIKFVNCVSHINKKYLLVVGVPDTNKFMKSSIYQVHRESFEKIEVGQKAYFYFDRAPVVFQPEGFGGQVAVFYSDYYSFSFGGGGDSSRPKFSIVRIYNDSFPEGKSIVSFGFKAGIIVDIKWRDGSLIAIGDPSRPFNEKEEYLPVREWEIQLPNGKQMSGAIQRSPH